MFPHHGTASDQLQVLAVLADQIRGAVGANLDANACVGNWASYGGRVPHLHDKRGHCELDRFRTSVCVGAAGR